MQGSTVLQSRGGHNAALQIAAGNAGWLFQFRYRGGRHPPRVLKLWTLDCQSRSVDKDYDTLVDMMATLMNEVDRCYEEMVALLCWTSTR